MKSRLQHFTEVTEHDEMGQASKIVRQVVIVASCSRMIVSCRAGDMYEQRSRVLHRTVM